jgi:taurine dioxygenase
VLSHPITGRKALYALGHGAYGIHGMPAAEAEELIAALKEHMLQEKYIYRHKYDVGYIAVWDTLQTMHSAVPIDVATNEADSRLL